MKSSLLKISAFAALLFAFASCSLLQNETVISLNLGGSSRAISKADSRLAVFDVYFNDRLVGQKVSGNFSAAVSAGGRVNVRLVAFLDDEPIATGEKIINVQSGINQVTIIMKEIENNYVAEIVGGQRYEDFKTAWNAVAEGQTLKLLKNVEITSQVSVQTDRTLDLNGFTLRGVNMTTRLITISANKKLTLQDSGGTGKLTGGTTSNGGGIYLNSGSSLIMSGGEISGNTGSKGAGVYVNTNSIFEMTGGTITNNTATSDYSGGVYVSSTATVKLSGNINISGNFAANSKADDLYTEAVLNITGPLTGQIGISAESLATASPKTVTNGWATYKNASTANLSINQNNDGKTMTLNNSNEYEIKP